jgi:hypothetical protein
MRAMSLQEPGTLWAHTQQLAALAKATRRERLEGTLDLRVDRHTGRNVGVDNGTSGRGSGGGGENGAAAAGGGEGGGGGTTTWARAYAAGTWAPRLCVLSGGELRITLIPDSTVGSGQLGGGGLGGGGLGCGDGELCVPLETLWAVRTVTQKHCAPCSLRACTVVLHPTFVFVGNEARGVV